MNAPEPSVIASWLDAETGVFARVIRYPTLEPDTGRDSFILWWTDGGPNDWTEEYDSEAVTMLRLACLIRCSELNGSGIFTHLADGFAQEAEQFFQDEVGG